MLPSEEIKQKINIVDLVGEYLPLKKTGVNYRAICPFHQEKTPSFLISPVKQIWHCFGCGVGGDAFEFIKQIEGVEFPEALRILATRAGVELQKPTIEYQKEQDQKQTLFAINDLAAKYYAKVLAESSLAQEARDYLAKRGLKPETLKTWQLGYAPDDFHAFENFIVKKGFQRQETLEAGLLAEKDGHFFDRFRGRIMFPLLDIHGRAVGFTGRVLIEQEGVGKYVNSPQTAIYHKSELLFGLHLAKTEIKKQDEVVVVEGNLDVIACHEAGFSNVVGSSGTALSESQLLLIQRFTNNLNFALDVDEAGFLATRRMVELALKLGFNVRITSLPKALAKDPDELIRRHLSLWVEQLKTAQNFLDFYFERVFDKLDLSSNLSKKEAVSELLPLLSLLPHPLDRAHYAQKLSLTLGVDEKLVIELLNKYQSSKKEIGIPADQPFRSPHSSNKTKEELLERRVLGLLLKFGSSFKEAWESLSPEDFLHPILREIFLRAFSLVKEEQFDDRRFPEILPRFAQEIEFLIFAVENELSLLSDFNLEDVKRQFINEFKQEVLKRRLKELSSRIKQAEAVGQGGEVKILSVEFNNLAKELNRYSFF